MRNVVGECFLFVLLMLAQDVYAASLLKSQSFPKTFQDLSFAQRINVLSEGYEPWESEYDASGRCISGCAYAGITIAQELENIDNNTKSAQNNLYKSGYSVNQNGSVYKTSGGVSAEQKIVENIPRCYPYQPDIAAGQVVPVGEPLTGKPQITSPYGRRVHPVSGNDSVHSGVDFAAASGTSVFSPASGTVVSVWTDSSCGKGIRISHSAGYETVYCHLSQQLVSAGDSVAAGCEIAKTGNTGRSTGPHLHYGIKYNGQYINPTSWIGRN